MEHYVGQMGDPAMRRMYDSSWDGIDKTREVSAVRDYLLKDKVGVSYLNSKLAPLLSTGEFRMKFASLFCHKKPGVTRTDDCKAENAGDSPGCELGDLFVLFVLLDGADKLHHAAGALCQAKVGPKLDSKSQRALYDFDLEFNVPAYLANRGNSPGNVRKMPTYEEGRGRALRYMILCDEPSGNVTARHAPWGKQFRPAWSSFVDGLITGTDGLRVLLESTNPSSWDHIVTDLLHVGLNVPAKKPPRGNDIATQVATSLFNNFANLQDHSAETEFEGVPTLMIIAHAPEYKERR
ncbi:hypothetical protein ACOTDF_02465 [Achromobacter insuavis]|uniref:hypothetical protein n=1 Tax=Achromobacter insuavis TaxID=1287735 RepID=UPI003B9CCF5D